MAESNDLGFLDAEETRLTRLTCPECNGGLAQVDLPRISYFRCHVGHQYGPETLAAAHAETSESKLWGAVAALEEQAALQRYLASRDPDSSHGRLHGSSATAAERAARLAATLRAQVVEWAAPPDQTGTPTDPPGRA